MLRKRIMCIYIYIYTCIYTVIISKSVAFEWHFQLFCILWPCLDMCQQHVDPVCHHSATGDNLCFQYVSIVTHSQLWETVDIMWNPFIVATQWTPFPNTSKIWPHSAKCDDIHAFATQESDHTRRRSASCDTIQPSTLTIMPMATHTH